jgi:hypothetical protein
LLCECPAGYTTAANTVECEYSKFVLFLDEWKLRLRNFHLRYVYSIYWWDLRAIIDLFYVGTKPCNMNNEFKTYFVFFHRNVIIAMKIVSKITRLSGKSQFCMFLSFTQNLLCYSGFSVTQMKNIFILVSWDIKFSKELIYICRLWCSDWPRQWRS